MTDETEREAQHREDVIREADEWLMGHRVNESWRVINRLRDELVRQPSTRRLSESEIRRDQAEKDIEIINKWFLGKLQGYIVKDIRAQQFTPTPTPEESIEDEDGMGWGTY